MSALNRLHPANVPLPNGTKVTTLASREVGGRRIPEGTVGQVMATQGDHVDIKLATGGMARFSRGDLIPTKLGQLRYAVRRERAWADLHSCRVVETVVGSRAWGLATTDSDTDLRGVFVLPFGWTIGLVEPPAELISLDGSATYWEVHKVCRQALRADPNTLETLFVPGARALDEMGAWLLAGRHSFVSREIYGSFGRYALSQLNKLAHTLRLAEHRSRVIAWLKDEPHLDLDKTARRLAAEAVVDAPTTAAASQRAKAYIKDLYVSLYDQGLLPARNFAALVAYAEQATPAFELPRGLRPKNAYNLVRLIDAATHWLATGEARLEVSASLRPQLLAIKQGDVPLADVIALAESMMPTLEHARDTSPLPREPDLRAADALLRRVREEAARRYFSGAEGPFGPNGPPLPDTHEEP